MVKDNRATFLLPKREKSSKSYGTFSTRETRFPRLTNRRLDRPFYNVHDVTYDLCVEIRPTTIGKGRWPAKFRDRLGRWHYHRCACITLCSLDCASSRRGIDRLNPRGPHGDSKFVRLRAKSAPLVPNMAPVGGHVVATPSLPRHYH